MMSRLANIIGALLFASICLAAAVLAGASANIDAHAAATPPPVCCIYMIF